MLCFEMAAGQPPFSGKDHIQLYESAARRIRILLFMSVSRRAIVNQRYTCPTSFSSELTDLIKRILVIDVTTRLGCMANGNKDIQNHSFFDAINFAKIYHQTENTNSIPCKSHSVVRSRDTSTTTFLDKPAKKDPLDPSTLNQAEEPIRVSRHNLHDDEFRLF